MSEEEITEEESPAEFEEEEFPDDLVEGEEFPVDEEDDEVDDDDDDDDDEEDEEDGPRPAGAQEDEEDEPDPADVEADLDAILKDRIASGDDEEDQDAEDGDQVVSGKQKPQTIDEDVAAKREGEANCPSCFLLISTQVDGECPHCGGPV